MDIDKTTAPREKDEVMSEVEYAECSVCGTGAEVSRLYFDCDDKSVDAFYLTLCHLCKPRLTRPNDAKAMIAEKLWDLLDNIDTASDMFKPSRTNGYSSFENFYNYAMKESEKRHLLMKSDGYTLETCKQSEGGEE